MANLATRFHESLHLIEKEKANGISFQWKQFDLSDLLLAEWIADQIKPTESTRFNRLNLFKHQFHAWRTRRKFKAKSTKHHAELLVFFNSQNQWNNLQPIVVTLIEKGIKLIVVSTKPNLLVNLQSLQIPSYLVFGFRKSRFTVKSNIGLQHIIYGLLPKLNYLNKSIIPMLESSSLRYVLVGNDNTAEGRMIARIAQEKKIVTGSIQHGSMNRINPLHGRSIVNQFFVYGEKPKQELVYLGKNAQEIFVKGWPLQEKFKKSQQLSSTQWTGFNHPTLVLSFSGPGHGTTEAHHIKCIEAIKQIQDEFKYPILIKLHPKDNASYYKELNSEYTTIWSNQDLEKQGITFLQVLKNAQVVITGASNSALDALLMETEVITLDLINAYTDVDFVQDKLVNYCTSIDELRQSIIANLQKPKSIFTLEKKKQLESYYYRFFDNDYSPTLAMVNTIKESIAQIKSF